MGHQITVKGAIGCVLVFADNVTQEVNAPALSRAAVRKRRSEQRAVPLDERLVNKGPDCAIGRNHSANQVCLILNLLWQSCPYAPGIIERLNDSDRWRG